MKSRWPQHQTSNSQVSPVTLETGLRRVTQNLRFPKRFPHAKTAKALSEEGQALAGAPLSPKIRRPTKVPSLQTPTRVPRVAVALGWNPYVVSARFAMNIIEGDKSLDAVADEIAKEIVEHRTSLSQRNESQR